MRVPKRKTSPGSEDQPSFILISPSFVVHRKSLQTEKRDNHWRPSTKESILKCERLYRTGILHDSLNLVNENSPSRAQSWRVTASSTHCDRENGISVSQGCQLAPREGLPEIGKLP